MGNGGRWPFQRTCGDSVMGRIQFPTRLAAVAVLLFAGLASADDALRQKALQLNDITGEDAINGKVRELIKDKGGLKKLLDEAAAMVKEKEKDPPFSYNGAYILATSAYLAKDFDNSLVFYR